MVSRKKKAAIATFLSIAEHDRRNERKRRWWVRPWIERRSFGLGSIRMVNTEVRDEDPESFRNFMRMEDFIFDDLLERVSPFITKRDTNMRECISPRDRLTATLDFLASGASFERLKFHTRIAANTLGIIVMETIQGIILALQKEFIQTPSTAQAWEAVANQFHALWQFPHCIGALDGKHINFRPLRKSGSFYRNYKGSMSIVLMALVDANYKFLYIDVGKNGRCNDGRVFRECSSRDALMEGTLGLPQPSPIVSGTESLPYVIVADSAFPLKENILKPFPDKKISHDKRIFNYRLSRARRIVENAFGILANKFQILLTTIRLPVIKVEQIVIACCILHNFIIEKGSRSYIPLVCNRGEPITGEQLATLESVPQQAGNRASTTAENYRNMFKDYFNGIGKVHWQDDAVAKGNW